MQNLYENIIKSENGQLIITDRDNQFVNNMPKFIDFGKRETLPTTRRLVIVGAIILFCFLILLILVLLNSFQ